MAASVGMMQLTFRQMLFSRKFVVLLIITCLPIALVVYALNQPDTTEPFVFLSDFTYILYIQIVLVLVTLINATSLIRDEISNRTIVFLVTRSISRGNVALSRYIAHIPVNFVLVALPVTICYTYMGALEGGFYSNLDILSGYLLMILIGVMVYGAFFYMLGILVRHPLMIGLLFAFLWEVLLTNMPGRIPYVTILFYLRSIGFSIIGSGNIQMEMQTISAQSSALALVCVTVCILFIARRRFMNMDL